MTTRNLVTMGATRDLAMPDVPTVDLAILQAELPALEEIMRDVGGSIRLRDLVILRVPTGGVTAFDVSGADGEEQTTPTLHGVICHTQYHRVRWPEEEDREQGKPPLCKSPDAVTGVGKPGGVCRLCPERFESCKRRMYVVFLAPGDFLPTVIDAPPSSVRIVEEYTRSLITRGLVRSGVLTEFGLKKATNPRGNVFTKLTLKEVGYLTPAQRQALRERLALYTFTAEDEATSTIPADPTPGAAEVPPPTDADAPSDIDADASPETHIDPEY